MYFGAYNQQHKTEKETRKKNETKEVAWNVICDVYVVFLCVCAR